MSGNGYDSVWMCPVCFERVPLRLDAEVKPGPGGVLAVTVVNGKTFTAEAWAHLWLEHPGIDLT